MKTLSDTELELICGGKTGISMRCAANVVAQGGIGAGVGFVLGSGLPVIGNAAVTMAGGALGVTNALNGSACTSQQ